MPKHNLSERLYFAPNVVRVRKLRTLIFYTINPLLYENGHFAFLSPRWGLRATYAVHPRPRLIGKLLVAQNFR